MLVDFTPNKHDYLQRKEDQKNIRPFVCDTLTLKDSNKVTYVVTLVKKKIQ